MARYFSPASGFADKRIVALKIDDVDGHPQSSEVTADGTEIPRGARDEFRGHWIAAWTGDEMDRLVAAGAWREVDAPASPRPPAAPTGAVDPGDEGDPNPEPDE